MAQVAGFTQLLNYMAEADFFTALLPFLLTYIVTFLAIQRLPLVTKNDSVDTKKYSALISLIFAFFVANFLVQNPVYQMFFSEYLGRITIGLVGILGFMVLMGLLGFSVDQLKMPFMGILIVVIAVVAFSISGGLGAFFPNLQLPLVGMSLEALWNELLETGLIWILVIGGALYWVTSEDSGNNSGNRMDALKWLFGYGGNNNGNST